jgi:hypothetical protein
VHRDAARLAYYKQIRGYIRAKVAPAIEALRARDEGIPEHLTKVCSRVFRVYNMYRGNPHAQAACMHAAVRLPSVYRAQSFG